uniref:Uncharacterized protein n=1 Tax=Oryza glumipatula TaxID=40148 RepID=A0A0E0B9W2_9ORYZ
MIRPNLPAWCPDVLHPSLKREILRLAEWAKQQNAEDSTPALIIQVTELVQDLRLHLGEDPAAASTSTATTAPTSVADLLTEITRLGEILRQETPARV